jgi:hypothetical protein
VSERYGKMHYAGQENRVSSATGKGVFIDQTPTITENQPTATIRKGAMDAKRTTTTTANRGYVLGDHRNSASDAFLPTFGFYRQFTMFNTDTYEQVGSVITLPSGFFARDIHVWYANQNRIVLTGLQRVTQDNTTYSVPAYYVYSRDGTPIGGSSRMVTPEYGTFYFDMIREDDLGRIYFVEVRENTDNAIVRYPFGVGSEKIYEFDDLNPNTVEVRQRVLHEKHGYQLGLFIFDSLPLDVYQILNDEEINPHPGVTYDIVDYEDRYVELTLTGQNIDYLPVDYVFGSGILAPSSRFAVESHYPETVQAFNSSVLSSSGSSYTFTEPFGDANADTYELDLNIFHTNSDPSINYTEITFEMQSQEYINLTGQNITDRFGIRIYHQNDPYNSGFFEHDDNVHVFTLLPPIVGYPYGDVAVQETSTGGTIQNINLKVFYDVPNERYQFRLHVERDGVVDTISASQWFGFNGAEVFDSLDAIRVTLNSTDSTTQISYRMMSFSKPTFGTWFASNDVEGARTTQGYILEGGENTVRTYFSLQPQEDSLANYEEWTINVNLVDSFILGIPPDGAFDPTPVTPTQPSTGGGDWLQPFGGFSLTQSTFIYTVLIILLTWMIIMGYSIYVSNLTGSAWVTSIGVIISALTSILWVFVAVFIGWLPVWVIVLLILIGAGIATMVFRNTFIGSG